MWRPVGWITQKEAVKRKVFDGRLPTLHSVYEAGADAMLAALRTRGHHVCGIASFTSVGERTTLSNTGAAGTYVFIPDEDAA